MAFQITNSIYSVAWRGKAAQITATSNVYFPQLFNNQLAQISSSGRQGFVVGQSVDIYNYTFKIRPITPDARFSSTGQIGILAINEIITFFP